MIVLETNKGGKSEWEKLAVITTEGTTVATENHYLPELGKAVKEDKPFAVEIEGEGLLMSPVKSSNLGHLGWFSETMFVTFKGKDGFTMYSYPNVNAEVFMGLLEAESVGKAFNAMKSTLGNFARMF